ncbi:MAG: hypothetical protein V8R50_00430 [Clostridia bacterium]
MNPTLKGQCIRERIALIIQNPSDPVTIFSYSQVIGGDAASRIAISTGKRERVILGLQPAPDASMKETARIIDGIFMKGN